MDKFELGVKAGMVFTVLLGAAWVVGILTAVFLGLSILAEWLRCAC